MATVLTSSVVGDRTVRIRVMEDDVLSGTPFPDMSSDVCSVAIV